MSNHITVTGNLTRDPELRFTQSGRAVCNLGVADGYRYQKNNEWVEETTFHNLTIWGDLGENVAASLHKGDMVVATGRLQSRSYEGNDGEKKQAWDIIIDAIGPSLRFATAEPTRVNKTAAESGNVTQMRKNDSVYGDEEPF
jgi:single-strand DNA-binding protein